MSASEREARRWKWDLGPRDDDGGTKESKKRYGGKVIYEIH